MVAFISSPIDTLLQGATRARAPSHTCTAVPMLPCKPNSRCDLRETNLTPDTRWGSRSRDPIGIYGGLNYYRYARCRPLVSIVPSGLLDKKTLCEDYVRAQSLTRNKKLKEQYKKCNTWEDTEVACEDCNGYGKTTCATRNRIKIIICYTTLPDNEAGARDQLKNRLDHEYQHATDICNCNHSCNLVTPPTFSIFYRSFCERLACMEIRAYSVDGSCNHLQGDDRKTCVRDAAIRSLRGFTIQCKEADHANIVDTVMEKCYFDALMPGDAPPEFPL